MRKLTVPLAPRNGDPVRKFVTVSEKCRSLGLFGQESLAFRDFFSDNSLAKQYWAVHSQTDVTAMLISFSVSNFRSFGRGTLNMVASNKLSDHPNHRIPIGMTGKCVLRNAVIYSTNAAGKSNLVQAMRVANN